MGAFVLIPLSRLNRRFRFDSRSRCGIFTTGDINQIKPDLAGTGAFDSRYGATARSATFRETYPFALSARRERAVARRLSHVRDNCGMPYIYDERYDRFSCRSGEPRQLLILIGPAR